MWFLLTTGFLSIVTQVVLLRELNAAFYGIELIYLVAIAAWLLWTAAGAAAPPRDARARPTRAIGLACAAIAPVLLADVAFLRAIRLVFGGVPGAFLPFWQQLLGLTIALAPIGILLGLLFQWSARRFIGARRTLAQAYAIESAGAVAGGLATALLLGAGAQTFAIAQMGAFLAIAAPLAPPAARGHRPARVAAVVLSMAFAWLGWQSRSIDRRLSAWQHPALIEVRD